MEEEISVVSNDETVGLHPVRSWRSFTSVEARESPAPASQMMMIGVALRPTLDDATAVLG
jgi:hypothetical protein